MPYLARRLLNGLFLFLAVSILTFTLAELAPGRFFDEMRMNPRVSASTISALETQYGLDQPLPVKYFRWLKSTAHGDFGFSIAFNSPAGPIVWSRAKNTLLLTGTATVLAWLIAIPFGIWSGSEPGKPVDVLARGTVFTLLGIPDLTLALVLLLLAVRTHYFPVGGITAAESFSLDFWSRFKDVISHLSLPAVCLAVSSLPLLLSHIRTAMVEVMATPFILAARAQGIPEWRLRLRLALPAAANPLISLLGFSFGILLSSSVIVEGVFGWPGLGQLLIDAILQRDLYLVVDATVLASSFLIAGNMLADTLLYAVDPRIE